MHDNKKVLASWFLLLAAAAGCSSATEDTDVASESVVARCDGAYTCNARFDGGSPESTSFHMSSTGECFGGELRFNPDGTLVKPDGGTGTWQGNAAGFQLCEGDITTCRRCERETDSTANAEHKCEGTPDSCGSQPSGWCTSVVGCYVHEHVRYNGEREAECAGSARACDQMSGEKLCKEQGCTWR